MSETEFSKINYVIIGSGISSYLLSILLAKKFRTIYLLVDKTGNENIHSHDFSLVPISFLNLHSIPFNEIGFKNKSPDAYIERFIYFQKFFLPKSKSKGVSDWLFHKYKQFGIVNHQLFFTYITKLAEKEPNLKIIKSENHLQIDKIEIEGNLRKYKIYNESINIQILEQNLIISDAIISKLFSNPLPNNENSINKYTLKTDEILSDSVSHYFFTDTESLKQLSIYPCKNQSIIKIYTENKVHDPLTDDLIRFLQKKFDLTNQDIELISNDVVYTKINLFNSGLVKIIPEKTLFSYALISDLFFRLESIFTLSLSLDPEVELDYANWLQEKLNYYNQVNSFFLGGHKSFNLNSLGKILSGKDVDHINRISEYFVRFRLKRIFKKEKNPDLDIVKVLFGLRFLN